MALGSAQAPASTRAETAVRHAGAVLIGVAAFLALWRAAAVEPLRVGDDRSYGFHLPEPTEGGFLQWTEGRAAKRLECSGHWLLLDLVNGHPDAARRPVQLTVRVDGRRVAVRNPLPRWQTWTLPIGDACDDGAAVVELAARPTFRPFSDLRGDPARPAPRDERELGVVVRVMQIR
jgi:hypothetical protein